MTTSWTYRKRTELNPATVNLIVYAAAFISPHIRSIRLEQDDILRFDCDRELDPALIDTGIERLCARFAKAVAVDTTPLFEIDADSDRYAVNGLPEPALFRSVAPGLKIIGAPNGHILRFLDWAVMRWFADAFDAREEAYPNVIPLDVLAKTQHLSSFPEHLHFVTHLTENLDVIEAFAASAKTSQHIRPAQDGDLSPVELVHNPSTCYHCYAARSGARLDAEEAVTAVSKCHRYEAANHSDPGRLMEFTLREVIFVGSGGYVREQRKACNNRIEEWVADWQLKGRFVLASDPFFTDDFEAKSGLQHRLAMKYEFRADLPLSGRDTAILSSNLHGPTFGKAFDIRVAGGVANTGCFGVGLERLALVICEQYGLNPDGWPDGLRRDFETWRAQSPAVPADQR